MGKKEQRKNFYRKAKQIMTNKRIWGVPLTSPPSLPPSSPFLSRVASRSFSSLSAMEYDSSDILGHPTMPTTKGKRQGGFSFGRAFFLGGIVLLAIYLFANWTWKRYKRYREQGYKL